MLPEFIVNYGSDIAQIAGFLTASVVVYSFSTKAYKKLKNLVSTIDSMQVIAKTLSPNGGSSIRDAIDRIERRQVAMEYRERAVLSESSLPVFQTNDRGECIWVNNAYRRLVGKTSEQLMGRGWENILHVSDQARISEEWDLAIKNKRDFESDYLIVNKETGVSTKIRCRATVMKDDGKCIGWFGVIKTV